MMVHRAKIFDIDDLYTFGFSVMNTPPYNADFDGDEMNIHIPQSICTQYELHKIANIKNHIISSRDGNVIIEPVQDIRLATYLMTLDKSQFSWKDFMNINCYLTTSEDNDIKKNKTYTSKDIFSSILNKDITINNNSIKIMKGQLQSGIIDNRINKTIIKQIWTKLGENNTSDYLYNLQRLSIQYLYDRGFSVGLGDAILDDKIIKEIKIFLEKRKVEALNLITQVENNPEIMDVELLEETLKGMFNQKAKDSVVKIIYKYLNNENNFYVLVNSGAKGKKTNIHEIMGSLCQSIFLSKRIEKKVYNRSIPHFHQNDDSGIARGFVENSYFEGLNAEEFFFHHMAGREGLIDTAIKTADSGYIQRKMVKGLEDLKKCYDGTVRTATNQVIQIIYGDSNMNQIKLLSQKIYSLEKLNSDIVKELKFVSSDLKKIKLSKSKFEKNSKILKKFNNDFIRSLNVLRNMSIKNELNYRATTNTFYMPFDINSLLVDAKNDFLDNTELTIEYIIKSIYEILDFEKTRISMKELNNKSNLKNIDSSYHKLVLKTILMEHLHPKKLLIDNKLSKKAFDYIVEQILIKYQEAIVPSGEMVGALAALHMGEPTTQLTLNTFHATGSGTSGIQGVPRFKELIDINKNIKTPIMDVYMEDEVNKNELKILQIRSALKYTSLFDITENIKIIYDENIDDQTSKNILDKVRKPLFVNSKNITKLENLSILYRFKLNKEALLDKSINMLELKIQFIRFWKKKTGDMKGLKRADKNILNEVLNICILTNKDGADNPVLHIRFNFNSYSLEQFDRIKDLIMNEFIIKGFVKIKDVDDILEINTINTNEDGYYRNKEFIFQTKGIDLHSIRYIRGIDLKRTNCNDIYRIYKTFGIEAARAAEFKEMRSVFNTPIHFHHYSILVDTMCQTGKLVAMNRHGINKLDTPPLGKSSFENTIDVLKDAAVFCEEDPLNSVSARIMVGQSFKGGTGSFNLKLNIDMLENTEINKENMLVEDKVEINFNNVLTDIVSGYYDNIHVSE